jgi:hypothetical protein
MLCVILDPFTFGHSAKRNIASLVSEQNVLESIYSKETLKRHKQFRARPEALT